MNVINQIILWLSASECLAQIIKEPSKIDEPASLAEATTQIVSRCYEKQVTTVGLAGISDRFLFETLHSQQSILVTLSGNDTHDGTVDRESRRKLQLFVVTASSPKQLKKTLIQVKRSQWWNHMATFLIFDWKSARMEHGCSNAFEFLWTAWEMNLLKAAYLCVHRTRGRLIYSYNPYTSKAPEHWQRGNTYKGRNEHPWTLFFREYDGDERRICENLEFDKTKDLDGYKIYASVKEFPPMLLLDSGKSGIDSISGPLANFAKAIFHALNATAHLTVHHQKQLLDDIAMDTVNGISDVLLVPRLLSGVGNFTVSNAFRQSGLIIVTQYRGYHSQLHKLITVLDINSRIGLCLVALTIVAFFKYFRRESLGLAILNTLRIITYSSLTKVPKNQAARIYLAGVFVLVVTIVGIYQGLLASLLTKLKPLSNVDTIRDLAERGYTIHANEKYADLFTGPAFKDRFIGHDDHHCLESVVVNPSAACVGSLSVIFDDSVKLKLHISSHIVFKTPLAYEIREDWPLVERLNKILEAYSEAGITKQEFDEGLKNADSIAKFDEKMKKNQKCKVMTLSELAFAFAILGIGLACATVSFIVEVAISRRFVRESEV